MQWKNARCSFRGGGGGGGGATNACGAAAYTHAHIIIISGETDMSRYEKFVEHANYIIIAIQVRLIYFTNHVTNICNWVAVLIFRILKQKCIISTIADIYHDMNNLNEHALAGYILCIYLPMFDVWCG